VEADVAREQRREVYIFGENFGEAGLEKNVVKSESFSKVIAEHVAPVVWRRRA
jgi:hypothetical protein